MRDWKNVTKYSNIIYANDNALHFFANGVSERLTIVDKNPLSYLPLSTFERTSDLLPLMCLNGNIYEAHPWTRMKAIIDRVT